MGVFAGRKFLRLELKRRLFDRASEPVTVGRFEIQSRLGAGGMGIVYLAFDPQLERNVALKLIRPGLADATRRMLREARALARLSHPNVVTIHEVGETEDRVYIAMEYIEGQTLRAWLLGDRAPAQVLGVLQQAGRGLLAAHEAGLVHRDCKPENILVGQDGRVRVTDFGLARDPADHVHTPVETARLSAVATMTGVAAGTPAYMAPEQFRGEAVDARTDQFALCLVALEALGGDMAPRNDFELSDIEAGCKRLETFSQAPADEPSLSEARCLYAAGCLEGTLWNCPDGTAMSTHGCHLIETCGDEACRADAPACCPQEAIRLEFEALELVQTDATAAELDFVRALEMYRISCNAGDASSCEAGASVASKLDRPAILGELRTRACSLHHPDAC